MKDEDDLIKKRELLASMFESMKSATNLVVDTIKCDYDRRHEKRLENLNNEKDYIRDHYLKCIQSNDPARCKKFLEYLESSKSLIEDIEQSDQKEFITNNEKINQLETAIQEGIDSVKKGEFTRE